VCEIRTPSFKMISDKTASGLNDLETIRKELNVPVTEFCQAIGLPRRNYYDAKNGSDTRLSLDQWRRLAEFWLRSGKSIEHLLGCAWQDSLSVAEKSGQYITEEKTA
jgi:hypothetical protein